ncbi:MAG TPA: hypothetical protein VLV81_00020 [Acidimicrobiia bacterium]|nr:hypothetical protein [Acidimicrobiia bacterium]
MPGFMREFKEFINRGSVILLIGFALFLIVKVVNGMRRREDHEPELTEKDVLVEIRDALRAGSAAGQGPTSPAGK